MIHFKQDEWDAYVNDQMPDAKRTQLENHLYTCDQCLALYMEAIEHSSELPSLTTDVTAPLSVKKKQHIYQHTLFHYGLAAAVTLILTSTGVFHSLTGYIQTVEPKAAMVQHTTVSQSVMDKALSLIDTITLPNKERK